MNKEQHEHIFKHEQQVTGLKELILFNDDVNTFDFVIGTLIDVCEHDPIQAEQCALITHFKGKCGVKSGTFYDLEPLYVEMNRRDLTVEIT